MPGVARKAGAEEKPWSLEKVVEMTEVYWLRKRRQKVVFDGHKIEPEAATYPATNIIGLHAEAKSIFTLVAYRRAAKFADNQSERADNSHEDGEHKRDPDGRGLELPARNRRIGTKKPDFGFIGQSDPTPTQESGIAWQAPEPWASRTCQAIIVFSSLFRRRALR